MFKKHMAFLLLTIVIGVAGCTNSHQTTNNFVNEEDGDKQEITASGEGKIDSIASETPNNTNNNSSHQMKEFDKKQAHMPPDEIQHIITQTIIEIHKTMEKEQANHDWFMLKEENPQEFFSELQRIKQPLSKLIAEDYLDEEASKLLEAYTCYCDSYFLFTEQDTRAGLSITEQTDDSFTASTITLDDGFYGSGWTNEWKFVKEHGEWKLANYDYVVAEEEPLNLTFEQVEGTFLDPETGEPEQVTFIEYIPIDHVRHMVIQRKNGDYEIYNTETGTINYTAMEQYDYQE